MLKLLFLTVALLTTQTTADQEFSEILAAASLEREQAKFALDTDAGSKEEWCQRRADFTVLSDLGKKADKEQSTRLIKVQKTAMDRAAFKAITLE